MWKWCSFGADEFHQFVGETRVAPLAMPMPGRSPQATLAGAGVLVMGQQGELGLGVADARQVRGRRHLHVAVQLQHGGQGAVAGGAAGTVGAGEVGLLRCQLARWPAVFAGFGLGGEELS